MSVLNLITGRCDHAQFLYRLSLTKRTELREVTLHGQRTLYAYFSMALNVLSACHSIGTLSNSTTESSCRSRLDWKSSYQPERLTSGSANDVHVLRVSDSYPGTHEWISRQIKYRTYGHKVPEMVLSQLSVVWILTAYRQGYSSCTRYVTTIANIYRTALSEQLSEMLSHLFLNLLDVLKIRLLEKDPNFFNEPKPFIDDKQ